MKTAFILVLAIIIISAIIFAIYKAFKRSEKRAIEKLELEKEKTLILQKRMDEMNGRVSEIEKILKEVE